METRDIVPTYRVLTEPIYDIDVWFIRLTWIDALVCFAAFPTFWGIFSAIGLESVTIFGFGLEPTVCGGLMMGVVIMFISILHWIRPEGSIEIYFLGLKEPTKYIGRTFDKKWKPSLRPHIRKS